jgi:putative membrane protein
MDDTVPPRGRTRPGTRSLLAQLGRGACMGAADVVPGVSGGTLALLFGIYDRLLAAISGGSHALGRFARGDVHGGLRRLREVDWWFLIPLMVGLVTTVVLLAGVIEGALIDHPEPMAGLFLGLVVASVVVTRREVAWSPQRLGGAALVGIAVFAGLGYQGAPITDPSAPVLLASGAVAVCAMVLPGISGSFLLLMLGMYSAVIGMVDERLVGDAVVFGVGAIIGLACFSSLLAGLLERRRDDVLAVMVGLMVGSLRVLWPWPHGVGVVSRHEGEAVGGAGLGWPDATGGLVAPTALAVAAVSVVLVVDRLARHRN